jgi:hypothetical protein
MPKTIRFGLGLGLAGVQRVLELSVVVARLDVHQRRQLDSRMRFWKTKELGGGGGGRLFFFFSDTSKSDRYSNLFRRCSEGSCAWVPGGRRPSTVG